MTLSWDAENALVNAIECAIIDRVTLLENLSQRVLWDKVRGLLEEWGYDIKFIAPYCLTALRQAVRHGKVAVDTDHEDLAVLATNRRVRRSR